MVIRRQMVKRSAEVKGDQEQVLRWRGATGEEKKLSGTNISGVIT